MITVLIGIEAGLFRHFLLKSFHGEALHQKVKIDLLKWKKQNPDLFLSLIA